MGKRNPLNVLTLSPGYNWKYPACWVKNIKFTFRKFKFAWQRITKGFSDWDVYDLDDFYTRIFVDSLKSYVENNNGWPQSNEFPEFEDYQNYIKQIIYHFEQSIEGHEDICNEYRADFEKYLDKKDFFKTINDPKTPEEEEICAKYYKRDLEIAKYREENLNMALDMLKHIFSSLWW